MDPYIQTDKPSARIPQLDGVRGIAILLVIVWHFYASTDALGNTPTQFAGGEILFNILKTTWSGVDLFFVLSGFLIGGILLDHRDSPNYFRVFYVRRICRIVPLYFAWIILFLIGRSVLGSVLPAETYSLLFDNPAPIWTYFTFTQNFAMASKGSFLAYWLAMTWSLAIEEQFYLILPLMIRWIPTKQLPYVLVGLMGTSFGLRLLALVASGDVGVIYGLLPFRLDPLLLGVLCAYWIRQPKIANWLKAKSWLLYILLAGLALIAPIGSSNKIKIWGCSWLAVFYACFLLLAVCEEKGPVKFLTRLKPLCAVGVLAYGMYLFHQPFYYLMHGWIPGNDALATLLAFAATLSLAYLSWRFFEKPIIALGHRLNYAKEREHDRIVSPSTGESASLRITE